MQTFTLDTNCILAVDEGRAEAQAIRLLAEAHLAHAASVAVVAISASENQRGGDIKNFREFQDRLGRLGLAHLEILSPMAYLDVTFFDHCLLSDQAMEEIERKIHGILFPSIPFLWQQNSEPPGLSGSVVDRKWRNAKCDVQAMWSHMDGRRQVFVTTDRNFHVHAKKTALIALGAGNIVTPNDAVALL